MMNIKNILVATDFSEPSSAALAYGREFARMFGARLHVLHVVENAMLLGGAEAAGVNFAQMQAELEAGAQNTLDRIVTQEDRAQLHATTVVRARNSPALEIAEYAKVENVDIVVMGTHGRGMMAHLLMGNVAEKVVRTAPCPVLTVRHPQHEFIQPDALQPVAAVKR
jgi:nucleotide-binding universal stress UspA family protein